MANSLLSLVLDDKKTATCSSLLANEKENISIPSVGDYSIITDFSGSPKCIIQIKNVIIMPFSEMTYEICKREGEDDNLESWKESHINFFTKEGKRLGYTFTEDMMICFEDFEVVYKINDKN